MFAALCYMGFLPYQHPCESLQFAKTKSDASHKLGVSSWLVVASLYISLCSCCLVFEACRSYEQYPTQFSALDALAGMMMKGAAKCDKHAE